ncbi:acyl-CoA dehydrogenase family protein [Variovorax sp. J22P271]|uniref:acyl-CoA dehydrogenase family protein n=1 Tax=Variovorax davisae TaxID=3053515 RepID=UPI0025784FC8|nr:acyl-CoA dehydrogenase family protein [Variovorax sp. J22P271]MDM0035738.1 acyl-CoA dehydrogenase family protein [Variovorax sp. J22P271]
MEREDIDLLLDTARRWFGANHPLEARVAAFRSGHAEDAAAWPQMAELGWLGLSLPVDAGGFGARHAATFELIREAGRDARPEALDLHLVLAPLLAKAMPAQAEALASGAMRIGLADRAQGDDAARCSAAGRLEGRAGTALGGAHATHLLVPAARDGVPALLLADLQAPGVSRTDARLVDGRRAPQFSFRATPVLAVEGLPAAQRALDLAAAAQVADSAGVLDAAFTLTLDYLKQRTQFGKPLSAQQAVQHKMAEIFCDLQQLLALAGRVAAELDAAPEGPWPTLAAAKSFLGRRALRAAGQLIQVSGGIAVTEEYKLTHFYRRLHVAATLFGGAEAQLARIDVRAQLLAA